MQNDLEAIHRAGLGLAAVSYDSEAVLREFAARKKITYPLLADHESTLIQAFGVTNRKYPKGTLLDVTTEQVTNALGDVPVFGVAYPSVFVINESGKVVWRFVSETDELRLTGKAILQRSMGLVSDENRRNVRTDHLDVTVTASNAEIRLGSRVQVGVELKLPAGYHVYGPQAGRGYHGLDWRMDASSCWYENDAEYPRPQNIHFAFEEGDLPVYKSEIRVTRELVLKPVLSAADPALFKLFKSVCLDGEGNVKATGRLNVQTCNERQCFPPRAIRLEWKFKFVEPDVERSPAELRREFTQPE